MKKGKKVPHQASTVKAYHNAQYRWKTKQFLPIGEKLGPKAISAARAESISAARFLPGGQKPANTGVDAHLVWSIIFATW